MRCFCGVFFVIILLASTSDAIRRRRRRLPLPSRVSVLHRNPEEVNVNWEQPRGIYYVRFAVSIRPPSASIQDALEEDQTFRVIRGLEPGTSYVVSIRGITEDGRQSPTKNYPLWSEPLPPTNLNLEVIQLLEVDFTFGPVAQTFSVETVGVQVDWDESPSATSMSGYTVQISPLGGLQTYKQPIEGQENDDTERIFIGLIPGEEYTFTVRTHIGPPYNLVYSSSISKTIRIPPVKPLTARESTIGATFATIQTIGPLTGIYTSMLLELTPDHGEISPGIPDPDDLTHDLYTITNLLPNTKYTLDVYSVSHGVKSVVPITITFTTAPEPPVSLQVTDFTSESVTLQWDHPENLIQSNSIEYVIEYQDLAGLYEPETVTVTVDKLNTRVHATIQKLEPGTTYCFLIFTTINGTMSEVTEAVQTTIPLAPEISKLNATEEGIFARVTAPFNGQCPQVIVSYSPPLPGEEFVEPRIYDIDEDFSIPGISNDKKYTIHIRCVSNNVEGPPLVVSSRAIRHPVSGVYEDDLPRERLLCSSPGNPLRGPDVEFIAPNACCGSKPYRTINQECCGSSIRRVTEDSTNLCCVDQFYSASNQVCCGGGIVNSRSSGCGGGGSRRR